MTVLVEKRKSHIADDALKTQKNRESCDPRLSFS